MNDQCQEPIAQFFQSLSHVTFGSDDRGLDFGARAFIFLRLGRFGFRRVRFCSFDPLQCLDRPLRSERLFLHGLESSQQHDCPINGNGSEILLGAENGFFDQREPSGSPGGNGIGNN